MAGYAERVSDFHDQLRNLVAQGMILRDAWTPGGYQALNDANSANPDPVPGSQLTYGEWNVAINAIFELVGDFYDEHRDAIVIAAEKNIIG